MHTRHAMRLGQAVDTAGVDGLGGLLDAPPGNHPVSRDFGQRQQYKRTLEPARVRQRQIGFVQCHIVLGDNVDIGSARPVAFFMDTVAA